MQPDPNSWYVLPRPLKWIGGSVDLRPAVCGPVSRGAANGYALDHEFMGGGRPVIALVDRATILAGFGRVVKTDGAAW